MALPTQHELLKLAVLNSIHVGYDLTKIYDSLVLAINGNACDPDVETEEPECKTALLRAVDKSSMKYVKMLVDLGATVDHENARGETALSEAMKIGNHSMVDLLLSLGARFDRVNRHEETALTHVLRCSKTLDAVEWVLNHAQTPAVRPCDVTETIIQGRHRVLVMLLDRDLEEERKKMVKGTKEGTMEGEKEEKEEKEEGKETGEEEKRDGSVERDVSIKEEKGEEKEEGKGEGMGEGMGEELDLEKKGEGKGKGEENASTSTSLLERIDPTSMRTPLMAASNGGRSGTVVLLLDRGAKPDVESPSGHTALTVAAFHGHNDTVRALLHHKSQAFVDYETSVGHTALLQTCVSGKADTTRILLIEGADPNAQNKQSETPLTTAARCGREKVVMALMTGGAKVNQETRSGRTPLHEALRCDHPLVVNNLMLDVGIGLNHIPNSDYEMRTPLMQAVAHGSVGALGALLTKVRPTDANQIGVDLFFETNTKQTALTTSIDCEQADATLEVIEAMVEHTNFLNSQEGVEFNQAILITRSLLSKLQRYQKLSKQHFHDLHSRKESTERCQAAHATTEAMTEGLKMVEIMLEDMIDAHHDDDVSAAIDRARFTRNDA